MQKNNETTYSNDPLYIKTKEFKKECLFLNPVDENNISKFQDISFVKYLYKKNNNEDKNNLNILCAPIKLTRGGIPKIDDKFITNDSKRQYFWLPLDEIQPNSVELFKMLSDIDDEYDKLINTEKNINTILKKSSTGEIKPYKNLLYEHIIKETPEMCDNDENTQSNKKKFVPYKRIKVNFNKKYDEKKKEDVPSEITTNLYIGSNETSENIKTVGEFEEHMPWNSTIGILLMFNKFWISRTIDNNTKKRKCGFSFKAIQINVSHKPDLYTKQLNNTLYNKNIYASLNTTVPLPLNNNASLSLNNNTSSNDITSNNDDSSSNDDNPSYDDDINNNNNNDYNNNNNNNNNNDDDNNENSENENSDSSDNEKTTKQKMKNKTNELFKSNEKVVNKKVKSTTVSKRMNK